jgi:phosphatidylinositol 3-kinase
MVEAMGGHDSRWYAQFRSYACEAYNILRANADLMLSLLHLMGGSAIEALRGDPDKALLKLQVSMMCMPEEGEECDQRLKRGGGAVCTLPQDC